MDAHAIEEIKSFGAESSKLHSNWDQIKVPGLHPSMSMSDLVSHIEQCISGKMTSGSPIVSSKQQHSKEILEEIAQYLFNDSHQHAMASDEEQSLMSRVNSLCCLLQKDPSTTMSQNLNAKSDDSFDVNRGGGEMGRTNFNSALACETNDVSDCKQAQVMSRKDSFGELLLSLPRIASLPQFLFNLSQDSDNQAR